MCACVCVGAGEWGGVEGRDWRMGEGLSAPALLCLGSTYLTLPVCLQPCMDTPGHALPCPLNDCSCLEASSPPPSPLQPCSAVPS